MITAVIFDMNGVITDDEDCHELATSKAFLTVGVLVTPELYRKYCLGRTDTSAFKDLIEVYKINAKSEDLIALKTSLYLQLIKNNLRVYPGVTFLINRLHQKYNLALTTSSTLTEVETVVDQLNLSDRFKVIVCSKDVTQGKPHPEPYLLTAEKLGVACRECLVIEDSENGIKSAKAAGMKCIAIPNTEKPHNLRLADRIIGQYSEITEGLIQDLG